jgi:hypothetical protein
MSNLTQHKAPLGDRIQLPQSFDVAKLTEEVQKLNLKDYIYYDVLPLRSPAHFVDPLLPVPPSPDDYADGSWTNWLDTSLLKSSPYLLSIVDSFRANCTVNLVRLLRLSPGATVKEHTDPTLGLEIERSVIRLTILIITNDSVDFYLNNDPVPMLPGDCWYLRLSDPHKVYNHGTSERISMTIDVVPNDWVRSLIVN